MTDLKCHLLQEKSLKIFGGLTLQWEDAVASALHYPAVF